MQKYNVTAPHRRLDEIVLEHYGDLSQFNAVKAANPRLITVFLAKGDTVSLPPRSPINKEKKLW